MHEIVNATERLPCCFHPGWLATVVSLALLTPAAIADEKSANAPAIEIGKQKQLFVDDYLVAEKQNVTRELREVTKHGVVLEPSLPTDFIPPQGQRGDSDYDRALRSGKKPDF